MLFSTLSYGCILIEEASLVQVLRQRNGKYGVGAVCNGGGGASALVVELM